MSEREIISGERLARIETLDHDNQLLVDRAPEAKITFTKKPGLQSFLELMWAPSRVHGRPTPSNNIRPLRGVTFRVTRLNCLGKRLRNRLVIAPVRIPQPA
jgi:hypothetical protein